MHDFRLAFIPFVFSLVQFGNPDHLINRSPVLLVLSLLIEILYGFVQHSDSKNYIVNQSFTMSPCVGKNLLHPTHNNTIMPATSFRNYCTINSRYVCRNFPRCSSVWHNIINGLFTNKSLKYFLEETNSHVALRPLPIAN